MLASNSSMTCAEACEEKCCVGTTGSPDACKGFTGHVCKDNYSCNGEYACMDADIDLVVGGCRGDYACEGAVITKGVIRGCVGPAACLQAGTVEYGEPGAPVGQIKDGCVGVDVCKFLGAFNGYVGYVDNGCVGKRACLSTGNDGRVGYIKNACKGYEACSGAGKTSYLIGFIANSCIGKYKKLFIQFVSCFTLCSLTFFCPLHVHSWN